MPSVAIIYDTSYLMRDRPDGSLHDDRRLRQYDLVNFVFDETVDEIAKHLAGGDPRKKKLASNARMMVVALKEARTANVRYSRGSLAGVSPFYGKSPLGADSRHDRLLLGKAKALVENGEHDAVILACNDYGIAIDALQLREAAAQELREAGLPIFFVANVRAGRETLIDLYERLRFGLSWGRWKPECILDVPVSSSTRKLFLAPDGETLAGVDVDERTVRVWKISRDGSAAYPLEIRTERPAIIPVQAQAPRCNYTRQGSFVVTSLDRQGQMVVTQYRLPFVTARSSDPQYSPSSPEAAERKAEAIWSFSLPKRGSATRSPLAFSPDERFVAAGTDLYDLATGQLALSNDLRPQQSYALAFSADGKLLASGGKDFLRRCGKLTVKDIYSGERVDVLAPQSEAISVIGFSPTAQVVAAGTFSGDVHVWRLPDLTPVATHSCGDRAAVRSLVFHRDGESLAVGVGRSVALILGPAFSRMAKMEAPAISDGDVLSVNFDTKGQRLIATQGQTRDTLDIERQCALSLWSFPEGRHLLTFAHAHARWMEPDANGNWAITADTDNVLRVWRLEGVSDARRFRRRTTDRNKPPSGGHALTPTEEECPHTAPLEEDRVRNNAERPSRAEQAKGETVTQQIADPIDRFRHARAAASAGDAAAQLEVARCYFEGRGVDRDPVEGRRWIRQAAEQGFAEAQAGLADLYREGREGFPKSSLEAASCYEKAAAQGNVHAQYGLGLISSDGWAGYLPEDAGGWFEKAALQGHTDAQKRLADLYMFGWGGMRRDITKALNWCRMAADAGHGQAQYEIGTCFLSGRGVERSDLEAVSWFRKAAAQGVAIAQNDLGWMYEEGRGVPQDRYQAKEWYLKSATQGHPSGQRNLGRMLESGWGGQKDVAAAVVLYRKAAEQGDIEAQWMVGYTYLAGIGVDMNHETAAHWFRQAASQGHEESRKMLEELGAS